MIPTLQDHIPNPGSKEAIEHGCVCAIYDNHFGKGVPGIGFWISEECPLHGSNSEKEQNEE